MLRHFQTPKLRYYYAKLYSDQLQKIVSKSGTNPQLRIGNSGLDIGSRHLLRQANKISKLQDFLSVPSYKRVAARKSVFSEA